MTCPTAPNIIFAMSDQVRADFTKGVGFELDTMPFLDSIAAQGTRFRRAYTTAPACVPARTSLLTGRWPSTHRIRQNSNIGPQLVSRGDDLLDVLRGAHYQLFYAGKTHMYRNKAADYDAFSEYGHTPSCAWHPSFGALHADGSSRRWGTRTKSPYIVIPLEHVPLDVAALVDGSEARGIMANPQSSWVDQAIRWTTTLHPAAGGERGRRGALSGGSADRGVVKLRADRFICVADAPGAPRRNPEGAARVTDV